MQEFAASSRLEENLDHPLAPWLYAQSVMYCMIVSLSQGGVGLGCMWGKEEIKRMGADPYSDYFLARVLSV